MNILYRTQDIKLFVMICSLCQLGPFSLAQSHMAFIIISELSTAGLKSERKIEPILIETAHYIATGPLVSC